MRNAIPERMARAFLAPLLFLLAAAPLFAASSGVADLAVIQDSVVRTNVPGPIRLRPIIGNFGPDEAIAVVVLANVSSGHARPTPVPSNGRPSGCSPYPSP